MNKVLQKGQVRSTRDWGACMIRCMNVDEVRGVCKGRKQVAFCSFCLPPCLTPFSQTNTFVLEKLTAHFKASHSFLVFGIQRVPILPM